jgi:hypothetical protein
MERRDFKRLCLEVYAADLVEIHELDPAIHIFDRSEALRGRKGPGWT